MYARSIALIGFWLVLFVVSCAAPALSQRPQFSLALASTEKIMKVDTDLSKTNTYAESVRKDYEANLKTLVDVASVSADPAKKKDVATVADKAASLLKKFGAQVEIIPTKGTPIVY